MASSWRVGRGGGQRGSGPLAASRPVALGPRPELLVRGTLGTSPSLCASLRFSATRIFFRSISQLGRRNTERGPHEECQDASGDGAQPIWDPPRAGAVVLLRPWRWADVPGEEKGKRVNVERAGELAATGATVVGTACPFCQTMFRDAFGTATGTPPKLLDIAQIAAASLESADGRGMV